MTAIANLRGALAATPEGVLEMTVPRAELAALLVEIDRARAGEGSAIREARIEAATCRQRAGDAEAQVAAMKLRALAAHEAVYRAMQSAPPDAITSLGDHGGVHEAIHAILAVETESVTVPDEWRAHLARQDQRIDWLEAQLSQARAATASKLVPPPVANRDALIALLVRRLGGRVDIRRCDLSEDPDERIVTSTPDDPDVLTRIEVRL